MTLIHAKQRVDSQVEHINPIDARTISNIATMHVLHTLDYTPEEIESILSNEAEILRHFHYARSDSENIHTLGRFIKNSDYILKQCNKDFISSSIESTESDRGALAANLKSTFDSIKKSAERIRKHAQLAKMRQPRNIHYFQTIRDLRATWHITYNSRATKEALNNYTVPPMFIDMRQGIVGVKLAPLVPITLPCDEHESAPYQCSMARLAIKMRSSVVNGAFHALYKEAQHSQHPRVLIQSEDQISIIHDEGLFVLRKTNIEIPENLIYEPIWSIGAEKESKIPDFSVELPQKIFGEINPKNIDFYDYNEEKSKKIDDIYNEILAYEDSIKIARQNVFLIESSSEKLSHSRVSYHILQLFAENYFGSQKNVSYSQATILTFLINLIDHIYTIENEISSKFDVKSVKIDFDSQQSLIFVKNSENSENLIIIDKSSVFEVGEKVKKERPAISVKL